MVELMALSIPILALSIPIIAIYMSHRTKVAELKYRSLQSSDQKVLAEIEALRQQVTELRDTTTRYDMSFDTALQRLDSRMTAVEQRTQAVQQIDAGR